MNTQHYEYILVGILIAGAGMSLCALILTIILSSVQRPRLYYLMRGGMATVGFALSTFMMASWMIISLFLQSSLNASQILALWTGVACLSIPLFMGICAAIGPRFPWVLWLGRFLLYFVTPIAEVWIAHSIQLENASERGKAEALMWLILYMVVTSLWWEGLIHWDRKLRRQQRLPHELPA